MKRGGPAGGDPAGGDPGGGDPSGDPAGACVGEDNDNDNDCCCCGDIEKTIWK